MGNRRVHGEAPLGKAVGAQLGYTVPQWRLSAVAKYLYQYYAEDRFRGQEVGYQFF